MQNIILLGCLLIVANFTAALTPTAKHGAVMARTVLLDQYGKPILVEYNESGEEVGGQISYTEEFDKLSIMSAFQYRQEQIRFENYKTQYAETLAKDAQILSRETFLQGAYPTADGKSTITFTESGDKVKVIVTTASGTTTSDFSLPNYIKSVYVRGRSYRIEPRPEQLVLLSFSIDLTQSLSVPEKGTLLLGEKGKVIKISENNIAPRVGYFGDPNEEPTFRIRKNDDEIHGPVKGVKVSISPDVFPGSVAVTNEEGKYSMRFLLPYCPGGIEFTTDLWAELRYKNFNPNGSPSIPYNLRRQDWTYCYDPMPIFGPSLVGTMAYVNALAIKATSATPFYNIDFRVDVRFLTGRFLMRNPDGSVVEVADRTEYKAQGFNELEPKWTTQQEHYDFDNDGKMDTVKLGLMEEETLEDGTTRQVFTPKTSAEEIEQQAPGKALQAVYFSSNTEQSEPDLIRVADTTSKAKQADGFLKTISEEDLRQTDIYIFRESTGQLVLERKGLKEEEAPRRSFFQKTRIWLTFAQPHIRQLAGNTALRGEV